MKSDGGRLVAAYYGADEQDAAAAVAELRDQGQTRAWMDAGGKTSLLPQSLQHWHRTLLPGEFLVLAQAPGRSVDSCVTTVRRNGGPAVFVLPALRPIRSASSHPREPGSLQAMMRELSRAHGAPAPPMRNPQLYRLLDHCEEQLESVRDELLETAQLEHALTTSAEWLLDNEYLFQVHIAEVRSHLPKRYARVLPTLRDHRLRLRIYDVAHHIVTHTDFQVTSPVVSEALAVYQQHNPLSIAELWALPLLLRLAIVESLASLAIRVRDAQQLREHAYLWANRLLTASRMAPEALRTMLEELSQDPVARSPEFVTSLSERLHDDAEGTASFQNWVQAQFSRPLPDVVREEHQRETADRISIANAVRSLRQIARMDYPAIFDEASQVERVLRCDPSGIYIQSSFATRDRCRHAVEDIARRGGNDEVEVARKVIELARSGDSALEQTAVYYLLDAGRPALEKSVGSHPSFDTRMMRWMRRHAAPAYLTGLLVITLSFLLLIGALAWIAGVRNPVLLAVLLFLAGFPVSDAAIQVVNALIAAYFPPEPLPRMDYTSGVPAECATLIVVPMMLSGTKSIAAELDKLEIRYLGNTEAHFYFALLADFLDAPEPRMPADETLLFEAQRGIDRLNERHGGHRFFLFHRERVWSKSEQAWMGRERKRGKIEDLNAYLLRGEVGVIASAPLPEAVRFVITLDADTQLPASTGQQMVAALAHPLNRIVLSPDGQRRERGYSILQPRVSIALPGAIVTRFTRIFADPSGTDPYSLSVSDAYQELFGDSIFHGKAIYDLQAFDALLHKRFPDETLLSHDLIEGAHAGVGAATNIEIFENLPTDYPSFARRQHRWIRGDWQIGAWIWGRVPGPQGRKVRNPLKTIDRFRIFDNLRRSLVPAATVAMLVSGWFATNSTALWSAVAALAALIPGIAPVSERVARRVEGRLHQLVRVGEDILRLVFQVAFLPHQAWINLDAIVRVLYRRHISHKHLLEWQTAEQAEGEASHWNAARQQCVLVATASLGLMMLLAIRGAFWAPLPFLLLWAGSPWWIEWLGRRTPPQIAHPLLPDHIEFLYKLARRTWRYFDDLVNAENQWLPPDNTQLSLRVEVAQRTSPTNIGLSLTSTLAAHDFGVITQDDVVERCGRTIDSLERMERYEGHWLNWYDTRTLEPLAPRYVSSVDSGNLLASFWVLEQGLRELPNEPLISGTLFRGLSTTLGIVEDVLERDMSIRLPARDMHRIFERPAEPQELVNRLQQTRQPLAQLQSTQRWVESASEGSYWVSQLTRQVATWTTCIDRYLPWMETLLSPTDSFLGEIHADFPAVRRQVMTRIPSLAELGTFLQPVLTLAQHARTDPQKRFVEQLEREYQQAREAAVEARTRIQLLLLRVRRLGDGMDMSFLYDDKRKLFGIGYEVGGPVEFASYYDLLASESRLGSLVAIAKGDAPLEHWVTLGRPYMSQPEGQVLLSWSGTMFEFLMPLLYMWPFENSFLATACRLAVVKQMEHGRRHGVPWGTSESAYSALDANRTYQYRAFGVPALGLQPGMEDDLVVSPYSSCLALTVMPREAAENLGRLVLHGMNGPMGLFEALDFTREKSREGDRGVIVSAYMAHHQGMSLIAIDNALHGGPMQRRFHSDSRVQAVEPLLFERIPPVRSPLRKADRTQIPLRLGVEADAGTRLHHEDGPLPRTHLLGNGTYSVMLTSAGSGYSRWKDLTVTSWTADGVLDEQGTYFYIRDLRSRMAWSATHQPCGGETGAFSTRFTADRAEFLRQAHDIESVMEVWVAPDAPLEIRRLHFTNRGSELRFLEVTSYGEWSLASPAAERTHRAFSKLFVQTEYVETLQAIVAHRRPRSPEERAIWSGHMVVPASDVQEIQYETDRAAFLGRGGSVHGPRAVSHNLTGRSGTVLDPVHSLRCRFRLEPRGQFGVSYITAIAESREALLTLLEQYRSREAVPRAFEAAWTQAQLDFRYLGIGPKEAHRYQELAMHLLYPNGWLRASAERLVRNRMGQTDLWALSISGDLPIVTLQIADDRGLSLLREMLTAHRYWRMRGLAADLVVLNQESVSYDAPLRRQIFQWIESQQVHSPMEQPGGVFLRDWQTLSEDHRTLLLAASSVVLSSNWGSLSEQMSAPEPPNTVPLLAASGTPAVPDGVLPEEELVFRNRSGGFTRDGREYVIEGPTPLPWSNVIATAEFGTLVTERGLGYTWCGNSQTNRLTPWSNDPVCDPHGEMLYLRDETTGAVWTPMTQPCRVRHGIGYTVYERDGCSATVFVAPDAPVKIIALRFHPGPSRRLSVTWYVEWVLGATREVDQAHVQTSYDEESGGILARNTWQAPFRERVAFLAMHPAADSWTGDRTAFLGRNGTRLHPDALRREYLDKRDGPGLDPCGALQTRFTLRAGESREIVCLLGQAETAAAARTLIQRFRHADPDESRRWWEERLPAIEVDTPLPSVNILLNRWLAYQSLSCRFWGRSAFYQSSGAFGFRDQLQDAMALIYADPDLCRRHLLLAASRQFVDGDVQHWWHPETGLGARTRCSDDLVWLAYVTAHYVQVTGDEAVLTEQVPFLTGPPLEPQEHDRIFVPNPSSEPAPLLEHCLRAIRRAATKGPHGLPLFAGGDWNDGMNRVGVGGRGESVWLGWFLVATMRTLSRWDPELTELSNALAGRLDREAWDGEWYLRGFFDDGTLLGSRRSVAAQIDSLPQSWAVLAGGGDPERARQAVRSAVQRLLTAEPPLVLLFTPPFESDHLPHAGYVQGYPPGVRENGGQYTHGSLWLPLALAELGEGAEAVRLLQAMNPVEQWSERYQGEPYVVAADVSSAPGLEGRAGWTWYTGAAAWMYRVWLEGVLGFRLRGEQLELRPVLPPEWPGITLRFRHGDRKYRIHCISGQNRAGTRVIPLRREAGEEDLQIFL